MYIVCSVYQNNNIELIIREKNIDTCNEINILINIVIIVRIY